MTESTTAKRSLALPATLGLLLAVNVAGVAWLIQETRAAHRDTGERLGAVEHTVRIMRYEATSEYEGLGFNALLDHLRYWAPWLNRTKPGTDRFFVEDRVKEIVETMSFLEDAYPSIETAFLSVEGSGDATADEVRRWLLVAAHSADPQKGADLIVRVLTSPDETVSLPLRRFAASELLRIDKPRAGKVLNELMLATTQASSPNRLGSQGRGLERDHLFNYIDEYVASGHPDVEKVLIKILQRTEYHNPFTVQRCVEHLGEMKSRSAVSRIKKLYFQQAPVPGQVPNPVFRRKCLIAIVNAIGEEAVPFLKEIDSRESDAGIRAKLNEYKKQFDFTK